METANKQQEELAFYKQLLRKEISVIKESALKVRYKSYSISHNSITFQLDLDERSCSKGEILRHICEGNDLNSDGFSYIVGGICSAVAAGAPRFAGRPCKFQNDRLTIRDCEGLPKKLPKQGELKEDTRITEQEKNRQLKAIEIVEKNQSLNPTLTYYIFHPQELPAMASRTPVLENVYQRDHRGNSLRYSDNQRRAICNALDLQPLSVIQGPPGTGKTTVITEIVFQILAHEPKSKILICSQTNNAVDQVLENLLSNNIPVLRLSGITRPRNKIVAQHTIERKLEGWKKQILKNAEKNFPTIDAPMDVKTQLQKEWFDSIAALEEQGCIHNRMINSIRVIGATCNHIASSRYAKYDFQFDYVIMDESGKATVAESLVPIVIGKKLILVGDHRQLRPMLTANKTVEHWLREKFNTENREFECFDEYFNRPSLFEQVIENIPSAYKTQLTECRRCAGLTVDLTSKCFYEPMGDKPITSVQQDAKNQHGFPFAIDTTLLFIDIHSEYESKKDKNGSSYNEFSAETISEFLLKLCQYDVASQYSYGVISGYKAQYTQLRKAIYQKSSELQKIMPNEETFTISVFDRFQGMERDIVIVDLVKSGIDLNLGFLETPNRINVALSRQKKLLVIVGDYNGLLQAQTRRQNGDACALQKYLKSIPQEHIVPVEKINELFIAKN
ncbi:MAG: AAA family ATPase [Bacteroidales bacterium]|nr:AAA family ATPase [Bacteroidales bacterium]